MFTKKWADTTKLSPSLGKSLNCQKANRGIASIARTYALAGKREEARKNLDELLQMAKHRYVSPTSIALIYAALGDKDQAFAWLDEGDKAHDLQIITRLKTDPRYDSLRSDPGFADLVRRVGLP